MQKKCKFVDKVRSGLEKHQFLKDVWFWLSVFWFAAFSWEVSSNAIVTERLEVPESIPCDHVTREDDTISAGETRVEQECIDGEKAVVYEVKTRRSGEELSREKLSEKVKKEPVAEIILTGTRVDAVEKPEAENTSGNTQNPPAATPVVAPQETRPEPVRTQASPDIDYDDEIQDGYCNDGTAVRGNPHAKGGANACYKHGGWVGNQ